MPWVRALLVTLLAPMLACAVISIGLDGTINGFSFIPLIFAVPGSLVLTALYASLSEKAVPTLSIYLAMLAFGTVAGGVWLGFLSGGQDTSLGWGSLYGFSTAAAWIVLHFGSAQALKWSSAGK